MLWTVGIVAGRLILYTVIYGSATRDVIGMLRVDIPIIIVYGSREEKHHAGVDSLY